MGELLAEVDIPPLWGLISIRDFGTDDYPQADGDFDVLAGAGQIYVSTRSDSDGDVNVKAYLGGADEREMKVIYEGEIECRSGIISVTPPAMEDDNTVTLPAPGVWQVRIAVWPEEDPSRICVSFLKS